MLPDSTDRWSSSSKATTFCQRANELLASTVGGATIVVMPMESDSSASALSGSSASRKSKRGRRRSHLASKSSAPTQPKLVALSANGVPEPVGVLEEPFSSLEDARAATANAAIDAAPPHAAATAVDPTAAPAAAPAADHACGDPYEDWMHILCACPLYADLRNLDGIGVQRLGENWTFDRILEDQQRTQQLAEFADEVFRRRRGV